MIAQPNKIDSEEVLRTNCPERASGEGAKQDELPGYSQIFQDYASANYNCMKNLYGKISTHISKREHIYGGLCLSIVGLGLLYLSFCCFHRHTEIPLHDCTDIKNQCSDYSKNDYRQIINCHAGSLDNPFAICKECNNGCVVSRNKEKLCLPAKCGNHKGSIPHVLGLVVFCLIGVLCSPIGLIIIFDPPKQKTN